ncbi:MAG: YigZ family protein, partial [Parabacteroides sp.]|nr:YigZ family protein [Parabacteroides sp.]
EERTVDEDIVVRFEYPFLNGIMRIVKEESPIVVTKKFDMDCEMTLRIRKGLAGQLKERLLKVETATIK